MRIISRTIDTITRHFTMSEAGKLVECGMNNATTTIPYALRDAFRDVYQQAGLYERWVLRAAYRKAENNLFQVRVAMLFSNGWKDPAYEDQVVAKAAANCAEGSYDL